MFCFHCSFTPTSTLGDVNTLVSMVDQHLLVNLTAEFKFLTTVFYCTTRMAVDFGMMLSLALRRTLRSGPTQLINESIIKILLMTRGLDYEHMIKARAHKGGVRIGKTPKKLHSICCP
jgi:hypothetical protein